VIFLGIAACGGGGGSGGGDGGSGGGAPVTMSLSAVAATPSEVQVTWSQDTTAGLIGYDLFRNGTAAFATHLSGTSVTDRNLQHGTTYCYQVYAVVALLGVVGQSNQSCVSTQSGASGWSISAAGTGFHPGFALAATGVKHLVLRRADGLHYAVNSGTNWVDTLVDANAGSAGGQTAIALDNTGAVHLVYGRDVSGGVFHASNVSGAWVIETVSVSGGWVAALAIDAANKLHIAYNDASPSLSLWYASNVGGTWQREFLAGYANNIQVAGIALDGAGVVHIGYAVGDGLCAIRHAQNPAGVWSDSVIDGNARCGVALAVDGTGIPHLAYQRSMQVFHARLAAGVWNTEVVDTLSWIGGELIAMAADNGGRLHLSYQDQNGDLKYANNVGGAWQTSYIDKAAADSVLRIGADGKAYILYSADSAGTLRLAKGP
jgi:hypothetical protein